MKLASFLLRYSRNTVGIAILAGVVSGASNAALLAIINAGLGRAGSAKSMAWSFVGLCILFPATRFASEALLVRLSQGAVFDLRIKLSRKIIQASLRQLEKIGIHRLMATLTEDVMSITNGIVLIPILSINVAIIIGSLAYLGWLSIFMLLLVLGFMAIGIIGYQAPAMKSVRLMRQARDQQDQLFKNFRALVEGAKELKLHDRRREAFFDQMLEPTAASLRSLNTRGMTLYTAAASWGQTLLFVLIGLLLFALPAGGDLNTRTLVGYVIALLYVITPLQMILNALPVLSRANVALSKIEELGLSLTPDFGERNRLETGPPHPFTRLELVEASHAYEGEQANGAFGLGPVNLSFEPGELVFLIGGNGSGKTTLAKLLTGLYTPGSGEIRINGQPVTDETRDNYRRRFSTVFSDFHLFDSLLGLENQELDADARRYLARLQLDHKVQINDGVFSTTDLSQGQRKRLGLLTAYLEDRPIYLFDEWAADQDPVFKDIFYLQLLPELKARGKLVLVMTHDDKYYSLADRIIMLDFGQVAFDDLAAAYNRTRSANKPSYLKDSEVRFEAHQQPGYSDQVRPALS